MLSEMNATQLKKYEQRIVQIKRRLSGLGEMRPGSLSQQYNVCGKAGCRCKDPRRPRRHGPYYQLSYVHQGKSTSQFIPPAQVKAVQAQLVTYKTFRQLTQEWTDLALRIAKYKLQLAKKKLSK